MLIVAGIVYVKPEARAIAVKAMAEVMAETVKEPGCISYVFSPDLANPGLFHLFEEWESQAHLNAHFETPHIAAFRKIQPEYIAAPADIKVYNISDSRKL